MAERFEIDQLVEIFNADTEFINQIGTLSTVEKEELSELLIDNKTTIAEDTARNLATANYLSTSIDGIGVPSGFNDLLQIYYTFKYAAIKLFFRENYHKYIPEYDLFEIKRNDNLTESDKSKKQLLIEACMREFDRFSLIIDNMVYTQDLNKVPYNYLNYLAQLIGYQRDDYLLLSNATFRELLKNIIEIYKIKGSNYSFELFFNFLGFDITVNEYWFDKRYGDSGIVTNQHTGSVNKKSYLFYLTPTKPTKFIPSDMSNSYLVNEDQVTTPRNIRMFNQYTGWKDAGDTRGFSYRQLIGDTTGYTGDIYTWFKTNIIQYSLSSLGTEQEPELDADELEKIEFYASFLSPIYAQRQISVIAAPYSEDVSNYLTIGDANRADPIYRDQINYSRNYYVRSIDANIGDTINAGDSNYDDRAIIVVDDSNQELYNWIHTGDYIYLTGDTTAGDTNQGSYFVAGDTEGDSYKIYDAINGRTWVILKGPLSSASKGDSTVYLVGDTFEPYVRNGDTYPGTNQTVAGGYLFIGGPDTMMHLYEGKYPNRYYWGDSIYGDSSFAGFGDTRTFTAIPGDSILSLGLFIGDSVIEEHNFISGMPVTYFTYDDGGGDSFIIQTIVKEIGDTFIIVDNSIGAGDSYGVVFIDNRQFRGHYLSGHHVDTHYALYGDSINGDTNAISAYAVIKNANPTWSEEQVFIEINDKESDNTLYDYETTVFKIRPRELLVMVDTVRKHLSGDSTWSAGDSFVVGDTYFYKSGDSKERLYLGDTIYYLSSGDSVHGYEANTYVLINDSRYFVTAIGDSHIEIAPWYEGGSYGIVQKIRSWKKYTAINDGDTNSDGDSIFDFHAGFVNPVINNTVDLAETGPLTLGMNAPMEAESIGRPIELQNSFEKQKYNYWEIDYDSTSGVIFSSGEIVTGNTNGISSWVLGEGGDSKFFTLWKEGDFVTSEVLDGQTSGDSGTFNSITKYTDQRGLILDIDASAGTIQVYDPGNSGDSFISEWANLCWDDYVMIHEALDDSNNGVYKVSSSIRTVPGDTTVITLGDSIINGINQITSGGYAAHIRKSKIQSIKAVNANGVGDITLLDTSRKFYGLVTGDSIKLEDTGDSNEGVYTVGDSIYHYRTGTGDSLGYTYFELGDSLDHDSGDSGGTVELNGDYWLVGDSIHQSGFDFIEFIKMR